jgi:hypothetical protein
MASAKATVDHQTIRSWVEAKGGCPAQVKRTGSDDEVGIIRIDYPGYSGKESLQQISWDEFFEKFEESNLAFLYQDEEDSRFSKLVSRDSVDLQADGGNGGAAQADNGDEPRELDVSEMTGEELYARAKELDIAGRSKMRKKDLIRAIKGAEQKSR